MDEHNILLLRIADALERLAPPAAPPTLLRTLPIIGTAEQLAAVPNFRAARLQSDRWR